MEYSRLTVTYYKKETYEGELHEGRDSTDTFPGFLTLPRVGLKDLNVPIHVPLISELKHSH